MPTHNTRNNSDGGEVFVISVAAELAGMHAQTLQRTRGGGRRYSRRDVDVLREIQRLSQEEGVNLAGIKAIISLNQENENLQQELDEARAEINRLKSEVAHLEHESLRSRGEIVHVPRSTAVVMWDPNRKRRGRKDTGT